MTRLCESCEAYGIYVHSDGSVESCEACQDTSKVSDRCDWYLPRMEEDEEDII